MKKYLPLIVLLSIICIGATSSVPKSPFSIHTEILTLSADASGTSFTGEAAGSFLYQVEIYSESDDTMTFTINSSLGTELFTTTTTAATSGEISQPTRLWAIPKNSMPKWTLSGLGSDTVTIRASFAK